jgi:hypothetical protein
MGRGLSWEAWVDAIRAGRTFVTNGPLLQLEVNGEIPGGEVHLPDSGGNIVEKLELFWNGKPVETIPVGGGARTLRIGKSLAVKQSGWLTLRARGGPSHPVDDEYVVAETSPVYVYTGKQPIRSRADAEYFIRWIDSITKQAEEHPGWRSEKERKHVLAQFAEARNVFEQRAREAR